MQLRNQFNGLKTLIDQVPAGPPGPAGPQGPQARPVQLNNAMAPAFYEATNVSSANSNGVPYLEIVIEDPPTQGNVQSITGQAQ